ncbi:MAG: hypothetical protein ACRDUY_14250 [Nitriliruptorales bacterium]
MTALAARTLRFTREAVRSYPRTVAAVTLAYLALYLLAIQQLVVSPGRRTIGPSVQLVDGWASRLFDQIAPFSFEPIAAIRPAPWLTLLVAPVNIAVGLALAALVAANVAVAVLYVRRVRVCRTSTFTGLLGALPAFLTGFACCVPTVALAIGAQFTVALLAVRSYLLPLAAAALLATLAWNTHRERRLELEEQSRLPVGEAT